MPNIREKTARLRRHHVLEAAVGVFAAKGYHRATIRDVATAAGVADGSIYNLFANKAALLLAMLEPLGDPPSRVSPDGGTAPSLIPPIPADAETFVRHLVRERWAAYTPETLAMLRVVLSEVLVDPELRTAFVARVIAPTLDLPEPYFAALRAAGKLASDDVRMTLRLMTASFLGLVVLRLLGDEMLETRADEVPDALADLLLKGLAAPR